MKKFYTLDDLHAFCKEKQFKAFSATEHGAPLIVQSISTFEVLETSEDEKNALTDGLLPVKLKSCHTGKNRNKSGITDEKMELYKNTFKGRPILGAIYKTDTGEYEFRAHDMEIIQEKDNFDINYIEQPIGFISELTDPYLQYDEEAEKNYLMLSGTVFADYSKAAEILERRRTCKCSVEIAVEEMSYNCEEDYLSIDKFRFCGVTILGYEQDGVTEISEGMEGSKITIDDFSSKQNSMFANQDKIIEVLEKLNITISNFTEQLNQKGGDNMDKFNELLGTYGVNAEDVTFEIEGLTDEELEAKFAEVFKKDETPENFELAFELSHDDIRSALYTLLRAEYDDEDYHCLWIAEVYDDRFIYEDYDAGQYYRRGYEKNETAVSLNDDKVEVFSEWLSEAEKATLDALRKNYEQLQADYNELKEFKEKYDADLLNAEKDKVLSDKAYSKLAENNDFKALVENKSEYSVEELQVKADLIYAAFAKSLEETDYSVTPSTMNFNINPEGTSRKKAYGTLFDKK